MKNISSIKGDADLENAVANFLQLKFTFKYNTV